MKVKESVKKSKAKPPTRGLRKRQNGEPGVAALQLSAELHLQQSPDMTDSIHLSITQEALMAGSWGTATSFLLTETLTDFENNHHHQLYKQHIS